MQFADVDLQTTSFLSHRHPPDDSFPAPAAASTTAACALQREWLERQQKAQPEQAAAWPEHIFENFFILVCS
jgi:hypothetical protein